MMQTAEMVTSAVGYNLRTFFLMFIIILFLFFINDICHKYHDLYMSVPGVSIPMISNVLYLIGKWEHVV